MERADSALGPLIKDLGLEEALRLYRIKKSWKATLGEPLALHTAPTSLKKGLLHINADTPAWLQQTGYFRTQILQKLSRFGVNDMRVKLGRVEPEKPRTRTADDGTLSEADPALIEELVSSVEDGDLRESIRRAAAKALRSRKKNRV